MKLTEYDDNVRAIINPEDVMERLEGCPETIITCFAEDLIKHAVELYDARHIADLYTANGLLPLYKAIIDDCEIGIIMSKVGAPAVVCQYEELYALGVQKLVIFGTCGVLDRTIDECGVIIPDCAVRDEGTSYHYIAVGDEIEVNVGSFAMMLDFFKSSGVKYISGKVWTTDGIYRETPDKMRRRREEGCICVDMECAAIAALAQFRNRTAVQFFYAADNLDGDKWDERNLMNGKDFASKAKILKLAVGLALAMSGDDQ